MPNEMTKEEIEEIMNRAHSLIEVPPYSSITKEEQIRLTCLDLSNNPNADASWIVSRAKTFEDYVRGNENSGD